MRALLIRRPGVPRGSAWFRRIKVAVDGEVVARLRPGAEVTVELPYPDCWVEAHMDFTHSKPLRIDQLGPNDGAVVEVAAPANPVGMFSTPRTWLRCRRVR
jgi:hypothetical protein